METQLADVPGLSQTESIFMRFRHNSSPPPYLNRTDQFRMLRMVGLLALVVLAMNLAADPDMWRWLFPDPQNAANEESAPKKEIDYGVKFEDDSPLAPDAFRSQPGNEAPRAANQDRSQPAMAEAAPRRKGEEDSLTKVPSKVGDYVIDIDPEVLAPVSDDWVGIRSREAGAFYTVIAKARDIPLPLLENAGRKTVDYTVLMTDSEHFRGVPITIEGTIRRLNVISIPDAEAREEFGLDEFFEAWMFTSSSGTHPYRVICTSLPDGIPTGDDLEIPARFTGYFFKREGYESVGGFHKAPVLIGKTVRWLRPELSMVSRPQDDLGLAAYMIGLAVLIAGGLGVLIWRFHVSDKQFGQQHIAHFTSATPAAIQDLAKLETSDPNDLFRQMQPDATEQPSEGA